MAFSRAWRRLMALGLPTLMGFARRGFFIPHRHADAVPDRTQRSAYDALRPVFEAAEPSMSGLLAGLAAIEQDLRAIGSEAPPQPRWAQDWFPRLDAVMAYAMVRTHRPKRIVEVGSGHSTRFLVRAVRDGGLDTAITAVDPAPRADLSKLDGITLRRETAQSAGGLPYQQLQPGDFLMIDSSHVLMPGTDVDLLFNHILPTLPSGVFVHIHDIFLPEDYPPEWEWRGYNEQLGVAPMLHGGSWTLLWSSHYARTALASAVAESVAGELPLSRGAFESSLWIEKA